MTFYMQKVEGQLHCAIMTLSGHNKKVQYLSLVEC